MEHFSLLVLIVLMSLAAGETFNESPNLSRIDRLLEQRYNTRNQRQLNFDPRNYPENMRLNEVDSDNEWQSVKNRRQWNEDDDYVDMRASRPIINAKTTDNKKTMPISHPIPVLVPMIVSHPYPVPMFPMNLPNFKRNRPDPAHAHEKVVSHTHEHVMAGHEHDHDHEHQPEGHSH